MANFIKHTNCEKCGSSDGRAVYEDNSSHCFVCEHTVPSNEFKEVGLALNESAESASAEKDKKCIRCRADKDYQ